jgi:tetratricopeptide (TPR) repeat protein
MKGPPQRRRASFLVATFIISAVVRLANAQSSFEKYLSSAEERLRQEDFAGAEKLLLAAEKMNPKSFVVHNNLGALYLQQRRYTDSIREFTAARTLNPEDVDVVRNLGTSHFLGGDYGGALEPLMRAKELNARDLRTRYQLGYAMLMLDRPAEAQPELEYVRAAMPGDASTLFALAKVYEAKRDQEKAGETFATLQRAHPDSVFVHVLLGESYDIQENSTAAIAEYQKAIKQAPAMPRLHFDIGFLYWETAQYAGAVDEFKKELEISPGFAPALYYLGDIALSQEHFHEALGFFQAASRNSACLEPFFGQGKAYLRLNRPDEAVSQFERAASIDAEQPDVYYWMASAYRRLGKTAKSQDATARFQVLSEKAKKAALSGERHRGRWSSPACMTGWASSR